MKIIRNKTAYWGRNTFKASKDTIDGKVVTKVDIYTSFLNKYETTFWFSRKVQLIKLSQDKENVLHLYTGNLGGKAYFKGATTNKIDDFLNSFKH